MQKMMCSNNERLKKSRGIEAWDSFIRMRLDGQPPCQSTAMQWFSRVNLSRRGRHAIGRVSCAWPVTMCRVAWGPRPGLHWLAVQQGTGTIVPGSSGSRRLPGASVIARINRMWPGRRARLGYTHKVRRGQLGCQRLLELQVPVAAGC